jgi:hypothetical protein
MRSITLAALLSLTSMATAQACGSLAIVGTGAPGTIMQVDVTGAQAGGVAMLVIGDTLGSTTLPLPLGGSLILGLAEPFFPLPVGEIDAAGAATTSIQLPSVLGPQILLNAQAVVFGFSLMPFGFSACASNLVPFTIG